MRLGEVTAMWSSPRAARIAAALATPVLVATALAGTGFGSAQAAPEGCKSRAATQPLSPGRFGQLEGTAVLAPCDVWAMGNFHSAKNVEQTLIEHWNGSKWKVVPSPNP